MAVFRGGSDTTMSFLDKFTWKPDQPNGYSEVKFDFTEEESEAINQSLEMYAAIAKEDAPQGTTMWVHPKVKDGITAKALTEYVEGLMLQLARCSDAEAAAVMDKAIKAQMKAYAIHNLPVYLFQIAGMFEHLGDVARAKQFFQVFLQTQNDFKPDQVDTLFLNQGGFDIPRIVALARQKLG